MGIFKGGMPPLKIPMRLSGKGALGVSSLALGRATG